MPIVRLLAVLLFVSLWPAPVRAQFSQPDNSAVIQWWNAGSGSSGSTGDEPHRFGFDLQSEPSSPLDRIVIDQYHLQRLPHIFAVPPEGQPRADVLCYSIRNYLVVRDSPHSDATHPGGYSTCQPATRFRVHSVKKRMLPAAP